MHSRTPACVWAVYLLEFGRCVLSIIAPLFEECPCRRRCPPTARGGEEETRHYEQQRFRYALSPKFSCISSRCLLTLYLIGVEKDGHGRFTEWCYKARRRLQTGRLVVCGLSRCGQPQVLMFLSAMYILSAIRATNLLGVLATIKQLLLLLSIFNALLLFP